MSEQTQTITIPTHRYCPECGRESEPALLFCGQCGRSLTKSRSHRDQDASNDVSVDSPNTDEAAEESAISQPAQITSIPARGVAWIRRHRGISIAAAVVLVLCLVGGVSNAVKGPQSGPQGAPSDNPSGVIQPGANGGPPTVKGLRPDQQAYVCSIAHNSTLNVGYDPTAVYNWVHAFPNPNTNGITYDQVVAALQTC